MGTWSNFLPLLRRYGPTALVLTLPLIINSLIWRQLTIPQQVKLQEWRDQQRFVELKPKFEAVLLEAQKTLGHWEQTSFSKEDPSAAMETIERLAGHHRLEIKGIHLREQEPARPGAEQTKQDSSFFTTMSLNLNVAGSFDRLARWMNDIEAQSGLRIDSWKLASATVSKQTPRLDVDITVFLGTVLEGTGLK